MIKNPTWYSIVNFIQYFTLTAIIRLFIVSSTSLLNSPPPYFKKVKNENIANDYLGINFTMKNTKIFKTILVNAFSNFLLKINDICLR